MIANYGRSPEAKKAVRRVIPEYDKPMHTTKAEAETSINFINNHFNSHPITKYRRDVLIEILCNYYYETVTNSVIEIIKEYHPDEKLTIKMILNILNKVQAR